MKGNIYLHMRKQEWLAFFLVGRLYRATPETKFVSFRPEWKVMQTEFLLWWIEILFRVDFISTLM